MEKWKIAVIVLLVGALGGYGFYQQNAGSVTPSSNDQTPAPTPPPMSEKLLKLQGAAPPAWKFDLTNWVNTPKPIVPADLKGKVTVLEFWRSECSHCQEAAPHMEKLYHEYSPRGVTVVAIHSPGAADTPEQPNPENNWTTVKQRIKEWGLTYPIAFDKGGKFFKTTYGGETYPTILILDRSGIVRYINTGYTAQKEMALRQALEKVLKQK
jgi:thiol-disulfide isomerase/thioredoxin